MTASGDAGAGSRVTVKTASSPSSIMARSVEIEAPGTRSSTGEVGFACVGAPDASVMKRIVGLPVPSSTAPSAT